MQMRQGNQLTVTFLVVAMATGGLFSADVYAGDDEDNGNFGQGSRTLLPDVNKTVNHFYVEDCGGCHFPYQPGFLPARSWERIMSGLADHFGENAELPAERVQRIREFLIRNAAGEVHRGLPNKVATSLQNDSLPLRITETRFFQHEHRELSRRVVEENPKVRTFSNCDVCHQRALQGSYSEREVKIPGFSRWEDDD
jgi:hypothetical protein